MLAVLGFVMTTAGFTVFAVRPLWAAPVNQASGYPEQLLSHSDPDTVPVIGGEGNDALVRVDLVRRQAGQVYLTDPFTGKVIRAASAAEVKKIGTHPYALEWYGRPADRQLVLTFDDGPDPRYTPEILDILSREHVPATFFVTGQNAVRYPALVSREIAEGHAVGNHTLTHSGLGHGSMLDREDLVGADRIIRATAGYGSRLFRIPYGDPDDNLTAVLQAQQIGYLVVDYDIDTGDWQYTRGHEIPLPDLDGKGHVVLMHDGGADRAATVGLLSDLIVKAKAAGYTFTTAASLVPAGYAPGPVTPTAADHFTRYAAWAVIALPATLISWLFWAGAGSLAVMSLLYVTLALVSWRRQHRPQWAPPPKGQIWVTVALPCYNEEKVVAKTLTALARTRYQRFEVIAVDDGSTDDTWGVLTAFASVWPRLRVFRQQSNKGKAAALNLAIAQARGWIIVTLDGDTVFEPQAIGKLARHFTDPRVGVVAGQVKVGNRRNLLTAWQSLEYVSGICVTRMAEGLVGAIAIAPGACAAWRKRAIVEAGGYSSQTLAEDCDLTLSIQRLGYQVRQDTEAVAWTEAPMTVRALAKQRLRWTFGNLQAFRKHRGMVLRPRYGVLGMIVLPYALLSVIVPLAFMPLTYIAAGLSIASGRWQNVALFAVFVAGVHLIISIVAVRMVRERFWHLLVVPVYRLIYEPLRVYVLYRSLVLAAKGKAMGWYRPVRTGTVLPGVSGPKPLPAQASGDDDGVMAVAMATGPKRPGLTASEVAARLRRDGPNVLPAPRPPSPVLLLARQMTHFFALLLWVAAGLAYLGGMPQLAVAIVVVVLVNGMFAFAQEYRADRAGRRLRELLPARVIVRRDGRRTVVNAAELVVGDIVLLEAGDRVPADLDLLDVHSLALDESMLTGESVPVRPEQGRRACAGTFVVEGEAEAEVAATGTGTRLADIAALTRQAHRRPSPLTVQLRRAVVIIAAIAITVGLAFFGVATGLGMPPGNGFLLAVGVTVALVPEGLLPTVTLSLARAAQRMAHRDALVRKLESVETLGSTTYICTDKTGTLTRNEMAVVEAWTPAGSAQVSGTGYSPVGTVTGSPATIPRVRRLAVAAVRSSTGRIVERPDGWHPVGDPMEAALSTFALRAGAQLNELSSSQVERRFPFDPRRRRASVVADGMLQVKGAPDAVLPRCRPVPDADAQLAAMTAVGLRVLAVARRPADGLPDDPDQAERDLTLLGLIGLEDPPRDDVSAAIAACKRAGIRLAMVTGDHPATARAVAVQTGLAGPDAMVVAGADLPADEDDLGRMIDRDGVILARVTPEDKLRIACALQKRGHVVAMTGDGVNDGPALQQADIGVAMGASGTDVAREAADLVLLDDHFATIVAAVELGRATFTNIRRFLTYHLTDNVAELVPFVAWAITGGKLPLALGVLQILALDIGTDLLPALALGAEPANPRTMTGRMRFDGLINRALTGRVFGVLGPAEAVVEMSAFVAVLLAGGWTWGETPSDALLATASGTAFTAVVLGQMATAFACRSEVRWAGRLNWRGNPLLLGAVAVEIAALFLFVGLPPLARLLGGTFPSPLGWLVAAAAFPAVILADALHKAIRARSASGRSAAPERAATVRSRYVG